MKIFKILLNTFVIVMMMETVRAQEDASKRNSLLTRKNNARNTFGKPTTSTTTTPEPIYDDEVNDERLEGVEYDDENAEVSSTTTTTETTKAPIRSLIKPFRSNDDFLNTLKKRQQNAKNGKQVTEKQRENTDDDAVQFEPKPKLVKTTAASGKRRSFGGGKSKAEAEPSVPEDDTNQTPSAVLRPSRSRFNQRPQ